MTANGNAGRIDRLNNIVRKFAPVGKEGLQFLQEPEISPCGVGKEC